MAEVQQTSHHGESSTAFYLDQLFSILVSGGIAVVTLLLWQSNLLGRMLAQKFHIWVALGAFGLLGVVVIRAISLWFSVEEPHAGGHTHGGEPCGHSHGATCDHDHGGTAAAGTALGLSLVEDPHHHGHGHSHSHHAPHDHGSTPEAKHDHSHGHAHSHGHGHSHGDGHEHAWAPWRYVFLLLPIALYFLVLSNPAFDREPVELPSRWWSDTAAFQKNLFGAIINFIVIFRSILWEALPFIILGAIIAGILEEFLPQSAITAVIPRNRSVAIAMGGLLGIVFPMCECGIIPIMRRLLRKGLPLSCCIAYLLAGPVINIIVLLSTYAAFSGMENVFESTKDGASVPSYQMGGLWMLGFRAGMAYLVAIVTALVVERSFQKHGNSLLTPLARPSDLPVAETPTAHKGTLWQRLSRVSETALHDFIDITVFLILGALLAATTRLFLTSSDIAEIGRTHIVLAILAMMFLAIILCLCSEADAFVAASFVTLRPSAKLAFLVLGPMMDLKLYAMYTRIFRPRLIVTIYSAVVLQVFLYSLVVTAFWDGIPGYFPGMAPRLITPQQISSSRVNENDLQNMAARATQTVGLLGSTPPGLSAPCSVTTAWAMLVLNATNEAPEMRFTQLEAAAMSPDQRQFYDGKRVSVVGRFTGNEQVFRLTRFRINCCAADAQALNVLFVLDPGTKEFLPVKQLENQWVRVIGQVRFFEAKPGSGNYRTVLFLVPTEREPLASLVEKVSPPANPYVE
ncbi:MAG: permease [Gemmataceae bacterium]